MINETILLLMPLEDCSKHRLAKHWGQHLIPAVPYDLYLYKPLAEIFSKVIVYDYLKRITEIGAKGINREIVELVRKERPKYVVGAFQYYEFQESTFHAIRKEGVTVVSLFFDDEARFDSYSRWWIPYLDYCVTNDLDAVPKYQKLAARVIHSIPHTGIAINVDWTNIQEEYDVSFVGLNRSERVRYVNRLRERGIPVSVFGRGWGKYLNFEEMLKVFATSKINLNFSMTGGVKNLFGIKGRIFEICLAGGFLLTEYVPGIEKYFEIDKEIACFRDTDELVDKIGYYLAHDAERRTIAEAGWRRATTQYTPRHMLSRVFAHIENDLTTRPGNLLTTSPRLPLSARRKFSDYYSFCGMAFSIEGYKEWAKDAMTIALSYNWFNMWAWGYRIAAFLPAYLHPFSYRALLRLYMSMERTTDRLRVIVASVPYLRKIKQILVKNLRWLKAL